MVSSSNQRPSSKLLQSSNPVFLLLRKNHALSPSNRQLHEHQRHQRQPHFTFPDLYRASDIIRGEYISQELGIRRNRVGIRAIAEPWFVARQHLEDKAARFQKEQLVFRKNRFSEKSLSDLSGILRRNSSMKEIMFLESRIGCRGATLLGSALQVNDSLEELQIWEDSIGSKGAEELSKMIEANSSLKLFSIFDSSPLTATPLISAVLGMNREMEVHVWSGDHKRDRSSKVVEFLPESNTLRIYQIDISGSCRVAAALGMNTTVRSLDMTGATLNSRWSKEFRWVR